MTLFRNRPLYFSALTLCMAWLLASSARAVIFYATSDLSYNTTAPTGGLAGSGWQWVGLWVGFQGVPIGPQHFLAARHIGGSVGDIFSFNGTDYTTVAFQDDTLSDLRIWQVSGTFPSWAPLYRASDEVGRSFVVMGRGLTRGGEVKVKNVLKGWYWGAGDQVLRWGENTVSALTNGGSYWGTLLHATFDQAGGANEAALATGDSSGPAFINDGSGWKLAGLGAAVDGPLNTTTSGDGFYGAIFDARGLYYTSTPPTNWSLIAGSSAVPLGFYLTRVSARAAWIDSIAPPSESSDVPLLSAPQEWALLFSLVSSGAFFARRYFQPVESQ